jgi:hypothetical protein
MCAIAGLLVQGALSHADKVVIAAAPLWNKLASNIKVAKTVNQFKTLPTSMAF